MNGPWRCDHAVRAVNRRSMHPDDSLRRPRSAAWAWLQWRSASRDIGQVAVLGDMEGETRTRATLRLRLRITIITVTTNWAVTVRGYNTRTGTHTHATDHHTPHAHYLNSDLRSLLSPSLLQSNKQQHRI